MCGLLVALAVALIVVGYLRAYLADDLTGVALLALGGLVGVAAILTTC